MASYYNMLIGGTEDINTDDIVADTVSIDGALSTNPECHLCLLPAAKTATADQSFHHAYIAPAGATTIPTGTAPLVTSLHVAEPNITATGTVTAAATLYVKDAPTEGSTNHALWVDAGTSRFDGNLDFAAAANSHVYKSNTAAAFARTDGTTSMYVMDTRNTVTVQNHLFDAPAAQTLPNGATSRWRNISVAAHTVTLVGQTQVTTENLGVQLFIGAPTYAQSGGAVTVDRVSALHVGTPVAGSSVTITTNHIISTDTAGCFCTAAGVWTDTCSETAKDNIETVDLDSIPELLDAVRSVRCNYKDSSDGFARRFSVIAEEVPDFLAMPGRKGVAAMHVAAFALACAKYLKEQNEILERRLEALENR